MTLIYGARTPNDLIYKKELQTWSIRKDIQIQVTVDSGGDIAHSRWRGNVGVVPSLIQKMRFDASRTVAMVCGPEVMMRFTVQELAAQGIADEQIYLSMERNMKCATGHCGHCQYREYFVCKDGPVFPLARIGRLLGKREL